MLLHAGPVQALYDRGFLRYIQSGGHEIVRLIYFAVRDQDWQTMSGAISDEQIQTTPNTFTVNYTYHIHQDLIQMEWQINITGQTDGTITFHIEGTAQRNFLKNRAGFCVLHPITGVIGQSCRLEHPDGSASYGIFPTYISPHQPFLNLSGMEWPVAEQGLVRLEFSGDIFETEDQRNWSDASFKTYCTPLKQPFPAQVNTGDQIQQQVVFRIVKPVPFSTVPALTLPLAIKKEKIAFPKIGLELNTAEAAITPEEAHALQAVGSKHLRADIFLNLPSWQKQLERAGYQSLLLNNTLELALFFGDAPAAEAGNFVSYLQHQPLPVSRLLLFEATRHFTTSLLLQTVAPVLRTAFPEIALGGGSNTNFTELNRHPFTFSLVDFVTYPVNPQVHAFDNLTLIENVAAQADTVQSAQRLAGTLPVHVSPVTLKPHFNEVATSGQSPDTTPPDPRQPTAFIAGWTLASIKYLGEAGATVITYFETTGPKGIYEAGKLFPTGYLLQFIQQYLPEYLVPTSYSNPLHVTPLLLVKASGSCLLLANHTPHPQTITLPDSFTIHSHTLIDENTGPKNYANYLPGNQITLTAYQIVALEGILST